MRLTVDFTRQPAELYLRTFNDPPTTEDWLLVWVPSDGKPHDEDTVAIAVGSLYELLGLGESITRLAQQAIDAHAAIPAEDGAVGGSEGA